MGCRANILGRTWVGVRLMLAETVFSHCPTAARNATPYNSTVDDTVSYISRFQTINMALTPNAPGSSLPPSR